MDFFAYSRIKILKDSLKHSKLEDSYDCYVDEKTGKLIISNKKEKTKKDNPINSRFDILDLQNGRRSRIYSKRYTGRSFIIYR